MKIAFACAILAVTGLFSYSVLAQEDPQVAEDAGSKWFQGIDGGDLTDLYDAQTAPIFKDAVGKSLFTQNIGVLRIQSGGPANTRSVQGAQFFDHLPTGKIGEFYYIRYLAAHPAGSVFEDVYLEKIGDAWQVYAFYFYPAPGAAPTH